MLQIQVDSLSGWECGKAGFENILENCQMLQVYISLQHYLCVYLCLLAKTLASKMFIFLAEFALEMAHIKIETLFMLSIIIITASINWFVIWQHFVVKLDTNLLVLVSMTLLLCRGCLHVVWLCLGWLSCVFPLFTHYYWQMKPLLLHQVDINL